VLGAYLRRLRNILDLRMLRLLLLCRRLGAGDVNIESDSSCDLSSFSSGANREVVNIELSESTIGAMLVLSSAVFPTRV
jgi:hypothetical protein